MRTDGINDELAAEADDLEQELAEVEAFTLGSDFNTPYHSMARRSERCAELLDRNYSIAMTVRKVIGGIERFAAIHNCEPDDLDVDAKMTFDGHIIITIRRE